MRMLGVYALVALALGVYAPQARGDIIFSNFDVGDGYDPTIYHPLCGGPGCDGIFAAFTDLQQSFAAAFTPAQDIVLERMDLAVFLSIGPNEIDVQLTADDGVGAPGPVIEATHLSGKMQPDGAMQPLLVVQSQLHPHLQADTRYWISVAVSDPQTAATWHLSSAGDLGLQASRGGSCSVNQNLCFDDSSCSADETCVADPSRPWSVSGGTRGAFRLIGGCVDVSKGKVVIGKLTTPAGDDTLTFRGTLSLPFPFSPALNPLTDGIQVRIDTAAGNLASITLPGIPFSKPVGKGWTTNAKGTAWTFVDKTATPSGGIFKVGVQDKSASKPGTVTFVINAKKGAYPVTTADLPVHGGVVLSPPGGQCAHTIFAEAAPAPHCSLNRSGSTLTCK